jgi:L-iditol 2-dehydrogenase
MKVLRLHGISDLRFHDEEIPSPGQDEVLIQVKAVGICGSDLHWYSESGIGDARLSRPLVLGHEFSGIIDSGDRKGQRVAVDPALPCERCEFCVQGHPNLCNGVRFAGHAETDGALRSYLSWPERFMFNLPDSISDVEGAMLEPLGVAIHAVDLAHLKPGMSIGVFGCGPIGLMILQLARRSGATKIIATDRLSHRVDAAWEYGADLALQADGSSENAVVWNAAGKRGVDVAFEVAGENPAIETAVIASKPGGKVMLVGIPGEDQTAFTASTARRKGLTVKFVRRMKHVYPRAIALVAQKQVDVASLVTQTFPLDDYQKAFECAIARQGHKVVITL